MSLINKILASGLACGIALTSANFAQAYDGTSRGNGVIFRVENIKPIQNEDGLTTECEFMVTVYNRMDREIKEAELLLSWTDNVPGKYKIVDGSLQTEKDEEKAKTVISHKLTLKDLAPHQQKSYKEVIETERCFLLLDQVSYNVPLCIADGDDVKMKNNRRTSNGSCLDAFDYINSQNPEYYSEFKDIPDSDIEKMAEEQKRQDAETLENLHEQSMEAVEKVAEILGSIN